MGKKLLALALAAGAVYLFKTKNGAEIRKQVSDAACKLADNVKEKYDQVRSRAGDALATQTA